MAVFKLCIYLLSIPLLRTFDHCFFTYLYVLDDGNLFPYYLFITFVYVAEFFQWLFFTYSYVLAYLFGSLEILSNHFYTLIFMEFCTYVYMYGCTEACEIEMR